MQEKYTVLQITIFLLRNSRKAEAIEIIVKFFSYFDKINYQLRIEMFCSTLANISYSREGNSRFSGLWNHYLVSSGM